LNRSYVNFCAQVNGYVSSFRTMLKKLKSGLGYHSMVWSVATNGNIRFESSQFGRAIEVPVRSLLGIGANIRQVTRFTFFVLDFMAELSFFVG
jgi:hypothetical protein